MAIDAPNWLKPGVRKEIVATTGSLAVPMSDVLITWSEPPVSST
jgi:hypothetical protein